MSKSSKSTLLLSLAALLSLTQCLSVFLGKSEPYCFTVAATKQNDIRVDYLLSGLNED